MSILLLSFTCSRINNYSSDLHIIKGKSASYGRMKTAALGKLLSDFDLLYRSVALDIHLGKDRGEVSIKKNSGHDDWEKYTSTEVVDTLAASFSVLIQPSFDEPSMFDDMSSSEVTAKYIFELFNNSADEKKIKSVFESFSVFSMSSYKELLKDIYKQNIELGVHFHSNFRKQILTQKYYIRLADKIIKGIEKLSFNEEKKIKRVGRFRAVNCDTAHFVFVTNDDESYSGRFDKSVRENIVYISFTSLYNIHVNRLITKHASKEKPEIKDTISSYYEEK